MRESEIVHLQNLEKWKNIDKLNLLKKEGENTCEEGKKNCEEGKQTCDQESEQEESRKRIPWSELVEKAELEKLGVTCSKNMNNSG